MLRSQRSGGALAQASAAVEAAHGRVRRVDVRPWAAVPDQTGGRERGHGRLVCLGHGWGDHLHVELGEPRQVQKLDGTCLRGGTHPYPGAL